MASQQPSVESLINLLRRKNLQSVVNEIEQGITTFADISGLTEQQCRTLYGGNGVYVYSHLHPPELPPYVPSIALPLFAPSKFEFKLYGLDGNGDTFLPLQGREDQVSEIRQFISASQLKLAPIIISTSRGMGKTFLLKKLGANDINPPIQELGLAKSNGRTISFTASSSTVEKYAGNYELWLKDLFCSHLSHVFAGCSFNGVEFRSQGYNSPLMENLTEASPSFRQFVEHVRSLSVLEVYKFVMDLTRDAFNVTTDICMVVLIDEIQYLLTGLGITSTLGVNIQHTFLSKALTCFSSENPRPIIIMTGTNYGEPEVMTDYSEINPQFIGLTPFKTDVSREFANLLFDHADVKVEWNSQQERLAQAIQTLSAGIPRLLRLGYGSWIDNCGCKFSFIIQRFFQVARSFYKEASEIFSPDSTLSDEDLAMLMLCCNSFYQVRKIHSKVPGSKDITWKKLIHASVVFPCGNHCYCIPSVFWLRKNPQDNTEKMVNVNAHIQKLVPGVDVKVMNLDVMGWYDNDGSNWALNIGHYFEKLFGMSLAIKYFLKSYNYARQKNFKLSSVYYVPEESYFRASLDNLVVDLSKGFIVSDKEQPSGNRRDVVNAVYCNQKANSTAVFDSVIPMKKGYICIQNKNSFTKPVGKDIVAQLDKIPDDSILLWVYLGHDDSDREEPVHRTERVRQAIKSQKLIYLSSAGCCSPAILLLLSNLKGRLVK